MGRENLIVLPLWLRNFAHEQNGIMDALADNQQIGTVDAHLKSGYPPRYEIDFNNARSRRFGSLFIHLPKGLMDDAVFEQITDRMCIYATKIRLHPIEDDAHSHGGKRIIHR